MGGALSSRRRWLYAFGHPGFLITDRIVLTILFYYYLPPSGRGLVPQLPDGVFLGVLTAWGAARLLGGVVDSLADPFVGWASDRSRSRLGRRRLFLVLGLLPMAGLPLALFWTPAPPGSVWNAVWLAVGLGLYYVAFTVYVGPYLALIPELARDVTARVDLTSRLAVTGLPVLVAFGPLWLAGVEAGRALGLGPEAALRAVVAVLSLAALAMAALPILAVDERRHVARPEPSSLALGEALTTTLGSRPFLVYLAAQIAFILGVTMLQPAIPYYAVVVLGRDEGFAALLSLAAVPGAALGFVGVRIASRRLGARGAVMGCVALLAVASALLGALRPGGPGDPQDAFNLAVATASLGLAGFSLAGFLVLPHVLMGQVIDLDERRTGANRSAMFYGVQGLLTKWVYQVSLALMSFLLVRFGSSPEEPLGVVLIGPVAAALCVVSLGFWALYPERRVLDEAAAQAAEEAA